MIDKQKLGEVIRFGIVGVLATILQYAIYWLLIRWFNPSVAMTIGYLISFAFNFVASTRYTFRVKASAKRGAGFAFSHAVNYVLLDSRQLLRSFHTRSSASKTSVAPLALQISSSCSILLSSSSSLKLSTVTIT